MRYLKSVYAKQEEMGQIHLCYMNLDQLQMWVTNYETNTLRWFVCLKQIKIKLQKKYMKEEYMYPEESEDF